MLNFKDCLLFGVTFTPFSKCVSKSKFSELFLEESWLASLLSKTIGLIQEYLEACPKTDYYFETFIKYLDKINLLAITSIFEFDVEI